MGIMPEDRQRRWDEFVRRYGIPGGKAREEKSEPAILADPLHAVLPPDVARAFRNKLSRNKRPDKN